MKVYKFYASKEDIPEMPYAPIGSNRDSNYGLYAITTQKKLAEKFAETRNPEVFTLQIDRLDKEDAVELINEYRSCALSECQFSTKSINKHGEYVIEMATVVATEYESMVVTGESDSIIEIMTEGYWERMPPIEMYTKQMQRILKWLEYDKMHKLMGHGFYMMGDPDIDDYSAPDYQTDELAVFIAAFGSTL